MAGGTKNLNRRRSGISCTEAATVPGRSGSPEVAVRITGT
jgi:hypothetical protein